jgi:GTP cyclohydrolase IA
MHSSNALQLVHESPHRDLAAAEAAAAAFLRALGISLDSEGLAGTPARMARGYAELFTPRTFDLTTFPNDEGYDELVISRNLPLRSVCEHHMLPFVGIAHIGYLPGARIIGLSKLARVAEHFACRPQRQERLTKQIADWLDAQLAPRGVGVVIEAEHSCMTLRGRPPDRRPPPPPCWAPCAKTPVHVRNSSHSPAPTPNRAAADGPRRYETVYGGRPRNYQNVD